MPALDCRCIHFIFIFLLPQTLAAKPPHIILILADDLGFDDLSFRGSDLIPTPNIDALAYSGKILNRHYTLPICTPSRSALLTGLQPIALGTQGYPLKSGKRGGVPPEHKLMPEKLKDLGYKTHMVGKWHLGFQSEGYMPGNRGFDSFLGYLNGYIDYYMLDINQTLVDQSEFFGYDFRNKTDVQWQLKGQYATDIFTNEATSIIAKHDSESPLFLYLSHLAVHIGSEVHGQDGLQPPPGVEPNTTFPHIENIHRRNYASLVQSLDHSVAKVVEALKEKGMLEDSIILFLADNGGFSVDVGPQPNYASNWPLRGAKFALYEGGVRGAGLIWSPKLISGGIVDDQFYHISDWVDLLTNLAGGKSSHSETSGLLQKLLSPSLKTSQRSFLLNIDEVEDAEAVILDSRWKVVKQNYRNFGNFDHHFRLQESDVPPVTPAMVIGSTVGKILKEIGLELSADKIQSIRQTTKLKCVPPHPWPLGPVEPSKDFFCKDYCLFDILNDECELKPLNDTSLIQRGIQLLNEYRKTLVPQDLSPVDVRSNPEYFGGAWSPWL